MKQSSILIALVSVTAGAVNARQEIVCIICTNDFTKCKLHDNVQGVCIPSPDEEVVSKAIDGDIKNPSSSSFHAIRIQRFEFTSH